MLLYIHVPFCRSKCAYCDFHSLPLPEGGSGRALIDAYLKGLLAELDHWGQRLGRADVKSVFLGGGTPSLLPAPVLEQILERAAGSFHIGADAEISLEANPESALAPGWLEAARKAGVNRLSLGVQSFFDPVLRTLGRTHDARTAEAAFEAARAAGFKNISLDLMWGLPGDGPAREHWLEQLEKAMALAPEHLSAYALTLEEGTALAHACARGEFGLPDEETLAAMYLDGAALLERHGLIQYEISNFARPGRECRHNLGYWRGTDYLGLGPAAVSAFSGRRWSNPHDHARWRTMVESGNHACWQGAVDKGGLDGNPEILDGEVRIRELLMLRLRMSEGLCLDEYRTLSGKAFLRVHGDLASALVRAGLARMDDRRFCLTRRGMLVSDAILSRFFEPTP